jgi:hypothetical protein
VKKNDLTTKEMEESEGNWILLKEIWEGGKGLAKSEKRKK